ncbi:hypothetical protein RintRC_1887 [Richelia intracellularis]|nr:hypothetical protein RintRC_1887 [Richelia intracellularis]
MLDSSDDYTFNSNEDLPTFINYRSGYTAYGKFLQALGNSAH